MARLNQGVDAWNAWRRAGGAPEPDLGGADLSKTNLRGAILIRANLTGAILAGADLSYAH
jgi:uncharacterized protein YjbI with pentapeptide repeats